MTIPCLVLTGFLGSGKTTLLNRLVADPAMVRTLVLVNELGQIPLDHLRVCEAREDVVVLESGCVCCAVRADLVGVLAEQYVTATRSPDRRYERVVIETTGLADPTPVVATIARHRLLARAYHLGALVTTVDATVGAKTLERHEEARKQLLLADRVVITKTDLAPPAQVDEIERLVRAHSPHVEVLRSEHGRVPAARLLAPAPVELRASQTDLLAAGHAHEHRHGDAASFSVRSADPVDLRSFMMWLSLVVELHGEHLLRVKGLLRVTDAEGPVRVESVQHVVHDPEWLPRWPSDDHDSRLVVITRGVPAAEIARLRAGVASVLGVMPVHASP